MKHRSSHNDGNETGFIGRIDRAAKELNAFLLVLAIGLAVLDFTCFFAVKISAALPAAIAAADANANGSASARLSANTQW
jgi:hypothetical protein